MYEYEPLWSLHCIIGHRLLCLDRISPQKVLKFPTFVIIEVANEEMMKMIYLALFLASLSVSDAFVGPVINRGHSQAATLLEMARKPFISGNWKLNPQTRDEAIQLAEEIAASVTPSSPDADVALFVPYPFLDAVISKVGDKVLIGGEVRTDS
jgi:Triosephosphate isomerase